MSLQEPILRVQDVRFRYDPEQPKYAVDGVSLNIKRGEFVAVLGANGCGKSTLAKHFNAILLPEAGTVLVEGMDTRNEDHLYDVRHTSCPAGRSSALRLRASLPCGPTALCWTSPPPCLTPTAAHR